MAKFNAGDQVYDQTNPFMVVLTVLDVRPDGRYECEFQNKKYEKEKKVINEVNLDRYKNPAVIYRLVQW